MSEEILKSEKLKEAFENVMKAVKDIPAFEIIEGNTLFLVINNRDGLPSLSAKGKVIDIAGVPAMAAIKYPDILKALKAAVLMAEEYVNRDSANKQTH
jgi:hypothetical protein